MSLSVIVVCVMVFELVMSSDVCQQNETSVVSRGRGMQILSRKKRYLTFPEGSAFTSTASVAKVFVFSEPSSWDMILELDVIWPIPHDIKTLDRKLINRLRRPSSLHRRHKRDLYSNFEAALDSQGLPGKKCILRTICEAKSALTPPGVSFVDDILRVLLSNVAGPRHDKDEYDMAYQTKKDCGSKYSCPFSILDVLLSFDTDNNDYNDYY